MNISLGKKIILLLIPLLLFSAKKITDLDRAKVLISKGKYAASINYLKKAKEKQGETKEILLLFSTSYFQMKKYYWAEQWLEKCLSKDDRNVNALLMLYKIQDRLQKYKDAIKTLLDLNKIKKNDGLIYYSLGEEYVKLMEKEKDKSLKSKAISYYKKAMAADKKMYEPALKAANIYLIEKNYLEALKYFKKALKRKPDSETAKIGSEFCGFTGNFKIAEKHFKQKDYSTAIPFYKEAVKYKPDHYESVIKIANSYYLIKKYKESVEVLTKAIDMIKKPKEAYYLLGLIYYNIKEYKESENCFKKCIIMKPKDPKPYYNLGKIREKKEDFHKAIKYIKEAISRKYKFAEYHKRLGMLYIKVSEFRRAVQELEIAENLDAKYDLAKYIDLAQTLFLVNEGHKQFDKGKYKEALDLYEDAGDIMPKMAQIHLSIGNTQVKLKEFKDAIESLNKALKINKNIIEAYESLALANRKLKRFKEADRIYNNLKKLTKNNPEIYYKSGISYEERGDYNGAIKMFHLTLEVDKKYIKARERIAFNYNQQGVKLYNREKYKEARISFKKGLKYTKDQKLLQEGIQNCNLQLETGRLNSLISKGDRLYKSGKYKEAANVYKRVTEIKPKLYQIRLNNAYCYFRMEDFETAEVILGKLLKSFPNKAEVLVELAYLYFELEKIKKSEEILRIAERKNANYFKLYYVKGLLEERKGNNSRAIKNYKKTIKKNPEFYEVRIDLGNLYYKMSEYTKSGNEYNQLLKLKPGHTVATYNFGIIYQKTSKYADALKRFKKVESKLKNFPQYNFQIGKCYYYLKSYNLAMAYMKKAVDMDLKIIYVWGLANIYYKLLSTIPGKKNLYKKKALELYKICMGNKKNNNISLMARKAILELDPGKKLLYSYRLQIDVRYLPIIAGDYSYVYSDDRQAFLKIEKESEEIVWECKEPAPPSCQMIMSKKYIICGLEDGNVIAIDKKTGKREWKYREYIVQLKLMGDSILAINGKNDTLLCIKDGDQEWDFDLNKNKNHSIVTKDNDVLYFNNEYIVKLDSKSGDQLWKYDLTREKGRIRKANLSSKYAFINIKKNNDLLIALDKTSGKKLWQEKIPDELQLPPLVYVNKIICLLKNGSIYTFSTDGSKGWRKNLQKKIASGLISGNKLYVSLGNDKIYGLRIKDGKTLWTYQMPKDKKDQLFMIYSVQ